MSQTSTGINVDTNLNEKIQKLLDGAVKDGVAPGVGAITFNDKEVISEVYSGLTSVNVVYSNFIVDPI